MQSQSATHRQRNISPTQLALSQSKLEMIHPNPEEQFPENQASDNPTAENLTAENQTAENQTAKNPSSADFIDEDAFGALRLDHYLKSRGIAETGGQAKLMIQSGEVKLNGQVETRRRKKLVAGDRVEVHGKKYMIE